jgi:hypothetical protein
VIDCVAASLKSRKESPIALLAEVSALEAFAFAKLEPHDAKKREDVRIPKYYRRRRKCS